MPAQTLQKLDFQEKLLQSGKTQNADALLKRLKTLHQKLRVLEQDQTDTRSLNSVTKPLISTVILHHKDKGVKAYAACCLADLLRLYAPDAPYTPEETRDIFQFFSTILALNLKTSTSTIKPLQPSKGKANEASQSQSQSQLPQASQRITDVPYYAEYFYLLESLATIKSVVLACDVPDGEDIATSFFTGFVDIVRPDMSKNLLRYLIMILVHLADEMNPIPSGVLDCIVTQFENFETNGITPAFQLIVDVCNQAPTRFQRPMYAHFSEIQLAHGKSPNTNDLKTLQDSHNLMLSMYRHCPAMMINVVQQLEDNLRAVDEIPLRQLSTKTLGQMFGERPVVGSDVADLAKAYPGAWRAWLGRRVDKALLVRLAWVEASKGILDGHPELRVELEGALVDRIEDSDERVRAAICKVIGLLDYETALHHLSEETLRSVGARLSDKKSSVRTEAVTALTRLWRLSFAEIEANVPEAIRQFGWIPQEILHCDFRADAPLELRAQMALAFKSQILPLPKQDSLDEQAWMDRLLLVASYLDEPALRALERMTGLKGYARGASPYKSFIRACEDNNGGIIDGTDDEVKHIKDKLAYIINAIANTLYADSDKARKDIESFAESNDHTLYKCFKICVDPTSDLKAIVKARHEFLRRVEQSYTDTLETMTTLIENAGWNILNTSSITPLFKRLQRPDTNTNASEVAYKLLRLMAKEGAPMWKSHVPELVLLMGNEKCPRAAEVALQGLAAVCKAEPEAAPDDQRVAEKVTKIASTGTPRQAKFAARFIAYSKQKQKAAKLVESVLDDLSDGNEDLLLTRLRALSELALSSPGAFEERSGEIVRFVMRDVMLKESPSAEDTTDDEWIEESQLEILDQAKLLGMRIVTHRALGFCQNTEALKAVKPTFQLLNAVLRNDGQVNTDTLEGGHARQHMKLRAALCTLKLANARVFDKNIDSDHFELVASVINEVVFQVRNGLLSKLRETLPAQRLLPRWNIIPALAGIDPVVENRVLAKSIMQGIARQCTHLPQQNRIDRVELPFARMLLMCSHHPDIGDFELDSAKGFAKTIEFFLDAIAHRDNISLLYHIALKLKTVRDPESRSGDKAFEDPAKYEALNKARVAGETPEKREERMAQELEMLLQLPSANLYKMSELAQGIIQSRAKAHQWVLSSYPGKVNLPSEIFHHLVQPKGRTDEEMKTAKQQNMDMVKLISKTQFLSEELSNWSRSAGKKGVSTTSAPKRSNIGTRSSPVKRTKSNKPSAARKRRRTEESEDEDDDDEDEEDDEGDDDEEEAGEEGSDDEEEEDNDGDAVMGRGGKRGAKTKANKAVNKKKSRSKKPSKNGDSKSKKVVSKAAGSDDHDSDLTDEDE